MCDYIATLVTQTMATQLWQLFFFFSAVALPVWHLSRPFFSLCLSRLELKWGGGPRGRRSEGISNCQKTCSTKWQQKTENNNMEQKKQQEYNGIIFLLGHEIINEIHLIFPLSSLFQLKRNDENFNCSLLSLSLRSIFFISMRKALKIGRRFLRVLRLHETGLAAVYVPDMHRWGAISLGKCLRGNPQHKWGAAEAERRKKKTPNSLFCFEIKMKTSPPPPA